MCVIRTWRAEHGITEHLWWPGTGRDGFLYFARALDGTMKVGWSSDPIRRVRGLVGYQLIVAIRGCTFDEEGLTHRFLGSVSPPMRGREWYPAGSLVTSLAFRLRNAAVYPPADVRPYPTRPAINDLGKGAA
jgi:hypothetical protein